MTDTSDVCRAKIIFPPQLAMFPTLLYASASDSSSLKFVRYINCVIIIIIIIIIMNYAT